MVPSSVAKISRPLLPGTYPRTRLYRLLDRSHKLPITWVSGPPGCGKTTTVSGYVEASRSRAIWYEVDEGDADPATFFYYLGLAGKAASSPTASPLPILTPEFLPSVNAFTHRFFEDLGRRLGAGAVLVFDDLQNAPPRSPFFPLLREGLSRLPQGVTAILISRSAPPPVFARHRVNRQMGTVGWEEFRLTETEARGIARLRGTRRIPGSAVREAHRRADGWVAGVTLLLDAGGEGGAEVRTPVRRPAGEIFEYFGEEVYSRLGKDIQTFLLRSAFLPRMTASMAGRLSGNSRAGEILSDLCRHNYFTQMLPGPTPAYQYHALFREFLLQHGRDAFSRSEAERLRREAASILLEEGQAEDAAEHLRATGDWAGLTRVILREATSLIRQGRNHVLSDWIRQLPEENFRATPWLGYWLGAAILPFEPASARRLFEEALARFRQERDAAGAFLSWAGIVPAVWFGKVGYDYFDAFLPTLDGLRQEFGGFPSAEIEARVLCSMIQGLANWQPIAVDGEPWIARARELAESTSDTGLKGALLNTVLCYWGLHAINTVQVDSLFASLEPLLRSEELSPIVRIEMCLYAASNYVFMADHRRCLDAATEGLKIADLSGLHIIDMFLLGYATLASLHTGDTHLVRNSLRRMASLLPQATPHEAAFYHFLATCQALERGDSVLAERHCYANLDMVTKAGFPFIAHVSQLMGALVMRALGKPEQARSLLREARDIERRHSCDRNSLVPTILESIFRFEDGDSRGGLARLHDAMCRGRELAQPGLPFWYPKFQAEVAARALREGIEVPFVQEMIRKNRLLPGPGDLDLEAWPWPVRIFTLGRFSIVVDGAPPPSTRKVPQKPVQLLKALLALGGRDVPEEQLSEALWPDADGDLAHQSLATNLKRLRKRLGDDRAVLLREGRLTLNSRHCWVDAWAFERMLGRAAEAARQPRPGPSDDQVAARMMEKAVSLYRGAFLSGETPLSGVATYRERLRSKFLRAVLQAGREREQAGEWEPAVVCYQKGLEVDPLSEALCRALLACHIRMGRLAEAHAVYQRFRKTVSGVLGVSPSPDLEAILRTVPAGSSR